MKFNFSIALILFSSILPAQPNIQWQKSLGGSDYDEGQYIRQTNDGGYIMAGSVLSNDGDVSGNHGTFDFWVVKLTPQGSVEWKITLGGDGIEKVSAIIQTIDGGYIVTGYTGSDDGDVSGFHGSKDAWVVKLSHTGGIQWQKALGGSGWEEFASVEQCTDGGYILAGRAESSDGDLTENKGGSDFWIVKLNNTGSIEWQKSLGGSKEDVAHSIKQTLEGGYIVAGETLSKDGDVSENNGDDDYWIIKLNSSGNLEWEKTYGGVGLDVASGIHETNDGYFVCGYEGSYNTGDVTGHHGSFDVWVIKVTLTGELLWQKALGGSNPDWGYSSGLCSDNSLIITGTTASTDGDVMNNNGETDAWIIKLSPSGEIVWLKSYGGTFAEMAFSIQQTSDNGYIFTCYSWSNDIDVSGNHGKADIWVVKLSPESTPTTSHHSSPIEIYPNPAYQLISLQLPDSFPIETGDEFPMTIRITDLPGREIMRKTVSNKEPLNIEAIPNGLYLLTATTNLGKVFLGRFVKQE